MKILRQRGFTLVELIAVIVLLGVISVGTFRFIASSVQGFVDAVERDQIISDARFFLKRFNRQLRNALPNSLRVRQTNSYACLEYVPIITSTRYEDVPVPPEAASDQIEVVPFDGLTHASGEYRIYVYPLASDEVYLPDATLDNDKTALIGSSTLTTDDDGDGNNEVRLANTTTFAEDSPSKRLYVTSGPETFCVTNNQIRYYQNYGFYVSQADAVSNLGSGELMAENLVNDLSDSNEQPFRLSSSLLNRGLVSTKLLFRREGEKALFHNEVQVINAP